MSAAACADIEDPGAGMQFESLDEALACRDLGWSAGESGEPIDRTRDVFGGVNCRPRVVL